MQKEFSECYSKFMTVTIQQAVIEWTKTIENDGIEHRGRTKSSYISDFIIDSFKKHIYGSPDFHIFEKYGTTYFIYKDTFLIKVKKSVNNRAAYIPTKTATRFQNQLNVCLDLRLDDLINVYLYYKLDKHDFNVVSVYLRCEDGEKILWSENLFNPIIKEENSLFTSPTTKTKKKRMTAKVVQQDGQASGTNI